MRRDPAQLANAQFDVLIIGGGAFGAAAAREAALHGLRTAIIERSDFGSGASSECFKMVHGGIRYLQHADIRRLRLSCHERSTLLRIAPHLVRPLPIAIPTFGRGRRGRAFLGAGALLYDLLTFDRNDGIVDPTRRINRTRFLSRMEVLELHPHLSSPELSGAVVFEDGQMYNPARLVLAFVKAAVAEGAVACNYVEAQHYLWRGTHVVGVRALDRLTNETFDVRARLTLNAAGPWADLLNHTEPRLATARRGPFSRDAYFIVDRPPQSSYALALPGLSRDKDAVFSRSNRHLFTVPWRDKTLVGVWHRHWNDSPDAAQIDREELRSWIAELNTVHPALGMSIDEVTFANCGLVPFGETATQHELSFGKESRLIDHRFVHGVEGLVTLIGIRFTTARFDAARALGLLLEQWPEGRRRSRSDATTTIALPGGDITDFNAFRASCRKKLAGLPEPTIDGLVCNFGTEYRDVLSTLPDVRVDTSQLIGRSTLRHEVAYAVEHEMAVRLDDVVLRRTDLGAGVHPGRIALERAAEVMAQRLGWSSDRKRGEIELTERILAKHHARAAPSGQLQEAGYVTHQAVN
ncbi:MAG: FAD-dependent oxidoreductase [Gammaproteobacteria bacterium]